MIAPANPRLKPPRKQKRKRKQLDLRKTLFGKRKREKASPIESNRLEKALDGFIAMLSPVHGKARVKARQELKLMAIRESQISQLSHFDGARKDSFRSDKYNHTNYSIDAGLEEDQTELQKRCAELYVNNTVANSAIEGRVTHEVGSGITAQSCVAEFPGRIEKDQAKKINSTLEALMKRWSEYCIDKKRRFSLAAIQREVCRAFATYGEAFIVLGDAQYRGPLPLAVEVISPERIETPPHKLSDRKCRLGVQHDENDNITGYWIRHTHPGENGIHYRYGWDFFSRFDDNGQPRVLHVFDPIFAEQTRGIPWLAAAMDRIKDLDDFFEAELIAKQIEACFGVIFEEGEGETKSPHEIAERNSDGKVDAGGKRLEELTPGNVFYASHGQQVKTVNPTRPGANFAPFVESALRSIAAGLQIPYEILAKNFFRTTFSSGRLAMLDGRAAFRMRQSVLVDQFLNPLWRAFVHQAVFYDAVDGLIDWFEYRSRPWLFHSVKWVSKSFGFLDPEKEVKAHSQGLKDEITTKAEIAGEKGGDWEDNERQILTEKKVEIERHVELRKYQEDLEEKEGLDKSPYIFGKETNDQDARGSVAMTDSSSESEDRQVEQEHEREAIAGAEK